MSPPRVLAWPAPATPGQLQLQGLVMGAGTFYGIEQIEGLDLPPAIAAEAERAGTDGSFGGIDTVAKRSLILHMGLHPDVVGGGLTKAILARNLKAAFARTQAPVGLTINHAELGQLLLLGRPRRCAFAEDRTAPWHNQEGVLAQFDALDPLLYSAILQDTLIGYGTAGINAGFAFNGNTPGPGLSFMPRRIIQNGTFKEATTAPWLTTGSTFINAGAILTREAGIAHTGGSTSGKVVTSGASQFQGVRQPTLVNLLPNTSYTFTVWINLTTAGGLIQLIIEDVTNAAVVGSASVSALGVWQQVSVTIVTGPTGPVQLQPHVRDLGTAVARTFYVAEARGDLTASVQAYTDPLVGAVSGAIGGGGGAAGFATCVNSGNQPSDPVSTISAVGGPVTGPLHLERVESGEVITLNYNMQPNDVLELDHDLHTVTLNGNTNRADIADGSSAWWAMQPGNNTIHYRTDGPGAGSSAEIKWRDAWL